MKKVGRLTEKEARCIAILLSAVQSVSAGALRGHFKFTKRRAEELEVMEFTQEEANYIVSFMRAQ